MFQTRFNIYYIYIHKEYTTFPDKMQINPTYFKKMDAYINQKQNRQDWESLIVNFTYEHHPSSAPDGSEHLPISAIVSYKI